MSKRHFDALAREIAESNMDVESRAFAARVVVRVAQQFNPRFDPASFYRASGLPELAGD